jgi:acylphosphatase
MSASGENARVRLKIEGRVQGVFFRATAVREATRRGLTGWVRNCPDGSVELVAEGKKADLEALIAWCRHGPPGAGVTAVEIREEPFRGEFSRFEIRR